MKKTLTILFLFCVLIYSCKEKQKEAVNTEVKKEEVKTEEEIEIIKKAPAFSLQDISGNYVKLEDLRGKYLYVDIWATWCGPCIQQLPAMSELEGKYRDSNVQFVSISVDSDDKKEVWKKMVIGKKMKGIQLFAGNRTSFGHDYKVNLIPTFIIIGKNGELLSEDAPRPMNHFSGEINNDLVEILDELNLEENQ